MVNNQNEKNMQRNAQMEKKNVRKTAGKGERFFFCCQNRFWEPARRVYPYRAQKTKELGEKKQLEER